MDQQSLGRQFLRFIGQIIWASITNGNARSSRGRRTSIKRAKNPAQTFKFKQSKPAKFPKLKKAPSIKSKPFKPYVTSFIGLNGKRSTTSKRKFGSFTQTVTNGPKGTRHTFTSKQGGVTTTTVRSNGKTRTRSYIKGSNGTRIRTK